MEKKLKSIVEAYIASGQLAGAELMVRHGGDTVINEAYGYRDWDTKAPMPLGAIYRIYSMSKPVTSAAVMLLVDRGVISLDDAAEKYLTGFKNQSVYENGYLVPAERPVTIRDLMGMISGVCYPADDLPGQLVGGVTESQIALHEKGCDMDTVTFINNIGRQPLAFQPGEKWRYGYSADVLGAIVEVASEKRFGQFLKDELFEPLGMTDTDFWIPSEKRDRAALMYSIQSGKPELYTGSNLAIFDFTQRPAFESGGAGLASTARDYMRFAAMLMNGGELDGRRYLKEETVRFMRTSQLTEKNALDPAWYDLAGYGYGNLMRSLITPGEFNYPSRAGEYGWDGWAGTYYSSDPASDVTILFMVQRIDVEQWDIRRSIKRVVYEALGLL